MKKSKISKDHLPLRGTELLLIESREVLHNTDNPLRFWTQHATKPCLVDLVDFEVGQQTPKAGPFQHRWGGAYSGRPSLIRELLPAIKEKLMYATEKSCMGFISCLRRWWRLFDEVEAPDHSSFLVLAPAHSVKDLTRLHQQMAVQRLRPHQFYAFSSVAEMTRRAMGMRPLAWNGPEERKASRDLPTPAQSRQLFTLIKHGWFAAVDRLRLVDDMLSEKCVPINDQQEKLLLNAKFAQRYIGMETFPTGYTLKRLWSKHTGLVQGTMWRYGLSTGQMFSAFFPTSTEIRFGFHLALIGGGWNIQTLLDLPVDANAQMSESMPFLRNHPKDPTRYILTGYKERGASDHLIHGDWKSDRSPGQVIRTIVERTWPLRQEVVRQLRAAEQKLSELLAAEADAKSVIKARMAVISLQRISRSVWLYYSKGRICALNALSFDKVENKTTILKVLIARINEHQSSEEEKLQHVRSSDFRDIFAEYVYRISGGSILEVKKALGHRSLSSTVKYLDNKLINAASARTFVTYTNEMWQMCTTSGQLDHTVLRQIVEKVKITPAQILRLADYRQLKKSRLGIGCKNPYSPPARLDPHFVPDGQAQCTTQRCTLCVEHAVIAPEALEGLSMRLAELQHIRSRTPIEHFFRGGELSWQNELENTETALLGFNGAIVQSHIDKWSQQINEGLHRVPDFNGIAQLEGS